MTTLLYQDDLESITLDCKRCEQEYSTIGYFDEELEYYIEVSPHHGVCTHCAQATVTCNTITETEQEAIPT